MARRGMVGRSEVWQVMAGEAGSGSARSGKGRHSMAGEARQGGVG